LLDYQKYYLPNLEGKFDDYQMDDVIFLSTDKEPFVNKFLRGEIELVKVDETDNEKVLPNTTFKFERLSGRAKRTEKEEDAEKEDDIDEDEKTTTEEMSPADEPTKEEAPDIDIQDSFELITDASGRIKKQDLLYGDWVVTEIKAADGYVLPVDVEGKPTNKLSFTFNNETRKVSLKFYNKKKPEILVSTGSDVTGMFITLGVAIILLSLFLLLFVKHKFSGKKTKLGFCSVLVLGIVMLGGTTFAAQETLNMTPGDMLASILSKGTPKLTITGQFKIDPIGDGDAEYDPIEDAKKVDDELELEGDKTENPDKNETPSGDVGSVETDGTNNTNEATSEKHGSLVSTGENNFAYIIGFGIIFLSSLLLGITVKHHKKIEGKKRHAE